jgi:MHS family proline/betaine transporter-like MFS transporter
MDRSERVGRGALLPFAVGRVRRGELNKVQRTTKSGQAMSAYQEVLPPASCDESVRHRRALRAAIIGNTLEWYDFVVYAFLAGTIGKLFFPSGDDTVSLLITLATFGVGFVMRPVGAIVLGSFADRVGRKSALLVTILLMGLGTAMIGLAPTCASIGWLAPLLIVIARLIQGFSAGGELGSATSFMIENAPTNRRSLAASWQQASQAATLFVGSLVGAAVTGLMSASELEAWGWRVPFLIGLLIVPVGYYIRGRIEESPEFSKLGAAREHSPLTRIFAARARQLIAGLGLVIVWTVCTYFFLIYMPTYALRQLGLPQSASLLANGIALCVLMILAPVFGYVSDRIGRKPLLLFGAAAIAILSYPLIAALARFPSVGALVAVQTTMAILIAIFTGPAPAALGELYPTNVRSTGMSLAYNGAVAIFGGFAPFIATWMIAATGNNLAPAFYVVAAAVASLIAPLCMKETTHAEPT